ncbi:hypothetical protein FB45DRAFT_766274 [Roridomyces roridus]|uniref:Uncharacterized protein n=1 Tax=Roridomyces roridus TaxID=1738132 RepID=A0AAD7AZZ4_9AGAR|nr:hypothetical protein FB45DRAFT_766274 [Roridomyces roridus]
MVRNLPEEIVHEILCPALSVSDETFSASVFCQFPSQGRGHLDSNILLVSKLWLRVAIPLLYNVVILRSKGQAQTLALTLRSNSELGTLIKKLRVQGGYASSMQWILQAATKLTDICIALDWDRGDNASGLCRGLPLIDSTRVILIYCDGLTPAQGKLVDLIVDCVPEWKNLVCLFNPLLFMLIFQSQAVFEMPHDNLPWVDDESINLLL